MATGDLLTVTDYLTATGQNPSDVQAVDQAQIEMAITDASDAIRSFCDRDFTLQTDAVQAPKQYRWRGGDSLEIDDATVVNSVSLVANQFNSGRMLSNTEWWASSVENPDGILDYIEFYTILPFGLSDPQMGFTWNADNYPGFFGPVILSVDANWGWVRIPHRVRRAAVITTTAFVDEGDEEYTAESIAGYSRSTIGSRSGTPRPINALPNKAIALLDAYSRWPI